MAIKTVPGRPPADPWAEELYVRDWEAWLEDDGHRFAWIVQDDSRVGALRWVQDEVTQVLGAHAPEPPVEAAEYALMWVKPRVVHVYSFQPGLFEILRRQGLELKEQVFQLRAGITGVDGAVAELVPVGPPQAESVGSLYDQVFRLKGGRRVVWQYLRQFENGRVFAYRHQGRLVGLYADRLNPTGEAAVVWLGILPDLRRRGLGRRLLQAGLAARAAEGVRQAVVQVEATNTAALRLYESLGFAWEWTRSRAALG
ncbi:MAG: GNAT family N-acetyltransferase [Actinomycetia bacterium]|nr:GNAT family N-acetyltransferase [Actinomycetes bacterium]